VRAIANVLEDKMVKLTALYIAVISNSRSFDRDVAILIISAIGIELV